MRTTLASTLALAAAAHAQCPPVWNTAIGNPGIAGGYAAPVRGWNGRIYVGGSFTSVAGSAANRYLAAYDPAANTWSPLGSGISGGFTNAFMTSLLPFTTPAGERLVAGGFFDTAGGVPQTASLAMWNGASWEAMGTTWTGNTRGSIWSLASWQGRLYVGGGVVNQPAQIAGHPWAGFASWDPGEGWISHATTTTGFSPAVFALQVHNDGSGEALYAVGRFSSIDGIPGTGMVARWNGSAWSSVGGGLAATSSTGGLEAATVFSGELYVAGTTVTGPGMSATNVARWNGSTWTAVGGQLGTGRITSMVAFNDGTMHTLYIGGTAMPQFNYIARLENGAWVPVDGGITGGAIPPSNFPSVFGLGVAGSTLYVAGDFVQVNNMPANGLASRTACAAECYANCDGSTTPPILNVSDFTCFLTRYAQGDGWANCDGSTTPPVLNVADFTCFLTKFAAGCP